MSTETAVDPRKRPKQRRAQATVDAILDATTHILIEEGYAKASTNRIAKRAGVSIGSLYQYFGNKDALVMAVAERHADEMIDLLARTAVELADAPVETAVRSYIRTMFAAHALNPELHRVLIAHHLQKGFDHIAELDERARVIVRAYLETKRDELVVSDLDAAAFILVTAVDGVIHTHLYQAERISADRIEQEVVDLLLSYLIGRSSRGV